MKIEFRKNIAQQSMQKLAFSLTTKHVTSSFQWHATQIVSQSRCTYSLLGEVHFILVVSYVTILMNLTYKIVS